MRGQLRRALTAATLTAVTLGAVLTGGAASAAAAPVSPAPAQAQPAAPLQPVPTDLSRYLGTWNQVASIPAFFDVFCVRNTQARYSLNPDGTVRVQNTCEGPLSQPVPIEGTARVTDPATTGALQVTFLSAFGQPAFLGGTNYVVAAHSPDTVAGDYTWALVGDPARGSGFVLSRGPALTGPQWGEALDAVVAAGYDPCRFTTTVTTGGLITRQPLCTVDTTSPEPVRTNPATLQPVSVDVPRYLGTWNQLASIPAFFDVFCVRDTQATYSLNDDGTVRVQNRCAGPFGIPVPIEGRARVTDTATTGALQVSFLSAFGQQVYLGDTNYVVAAHDADYTWALVGSPDRSTGFILSRTPALDEATWRTVLAAVTDAGFDPCRLNTTVTTGGLQTAQPLCTLDPTGR